MVSISLPAIALANLFHFFSLGTKVLALRHFFIRHDECRPTTLCCDEDVKCSSQNHSLIDSSQHTSVKVDLIQTRVSAKLLLP